LYFDHKFIPATSTNRLAKLFFFIEH